MKTWNASEITPEVARATGVDAGVADKTVNAVLDFVRESLSAGKSVEIKDFGKIFCPAKGGGGDVSVPRS